MRNFSKFQRTPGSPVGVIPAPLRISRNGSLLLGGRHPQAVSAA